MTRCMSQTPTLLEFILFLMMVANHSKVFVFRPLQNVISARATSDRFQDILQKGGINALVFFAYSWIFQGRAPLKLSQRIDVMVSVKENEVLTEKNSSRASIFAPKVSYISD